MSYTTLIKGRIKMIISIDIEKESGKLCHPFTIKTFNKVDIEGMYFSIISPYMTNP